MGPGSDIPLYTGRPSSLDCPLYFRSSKKIELSRIYEKKV
jgi:hypothetical protein